MYLKGRKPEWLLALQDELQQLSKKYKAFPFFLESTPKREFIL